MNRRHLLLAALGALPLRAADVPRPSPDFEVTLPTGRRVKLSEMKGKVVAFACVVTT